MKKLIIALLVFASSCAVSRPATAVKLTVTHVERSGKEAEVYARKGKEVWKANCMNLPDSIKAGSVIIADPYQGQSDCTCIFKRIK